MKLSKSERHTAYIIMLAELEQIRDDDDMMGLCKVKWVLDIDRDCTRADDIQMEDLEELKNKKPNMYPYRAYWFPISAYGRKQRIEILKQCIAETYNF